MTEAALEAAGLLDEHREMRTFDARISALLRRLPETWGRRALARYFAWRFRRWPPSMTSEVLFVNYATYLGLAPHTLDSEWGSTWATLTWFEGDPYWLEYAETRSPVLEHLGRMIKWNEPFDCLVIDRSRVRGIGSDEPTHPTYHASFSLWRKMRPDEISKLDGTESLRAHVGIHADAYLYDEEHV